MLTLKKQSHNPLSIEQYLINTPGLADLHFFAEQARAGKVISLTWCVQKQSRFELTISYAETFTWKLVTRRADKRSVTLKHATGDMALIYNLLVSACGQSEKAIDADCVLGKSNERAAHNKNFYLRYPVCIADAA